MRGQRWLQLVFIQAVFTHATTVGVRVMAGYRAIEYGADPAALGLVASAFAVPALVCALPLGRLGDRVGGATVTAMGILLNLAGIGVALLAHGLPLLILGCALSGLGHIAVLVGQQTYVANHTAPASRDISFGWLTTGASVGQLVAPPAVGVASALFAAGNGVSALAGLVVTACFAALSLPLAFPGMRMDRRARGTAPRRKQAPLSSATSIPGLWRSMVVSGVTLASLDLVYTFFPVWATQNGIDVVTVGWLLALRAVVTVASRFWLGSLLARFGRKPLLIISISLACVAFVVLPFANVVGAVFVMIALGVGLGIPQPLTMSWVVARASGAIQGTVLGLRLTANRLAQSVVPLGVGLAAAPLGVAGAFWANAVLLAASVAITASSDLDSGAPPEPDGDMLLT